MGTSWVALSIENITWASSEMTSRKISKFAILMGWTLPSMDMWRGEVFAISDCLIYSCYSQWEDRSDIDLTHHTCRSCFLIFLPVVTEFQWNFIGCLKMNKPTLLTRVQSKLEFFVLSRHWMAKLNSEHWLTLVNIKSRNMKSGVIGSNVLG